MTLRKGTVIAIAALLGIATSVQPALATTPAWSIMPSPLITTGDGSLGGVSCPSSTLCIAVGSYTNKVGIQLTLAERWNGTTWSLQPIPNPVGWDGGLSAVSCVSASACVAVGDKLQNFNSATLAETWNGTAWSIQSTPNPTGASAYLSSVSCTSTSACMAVGTAYAINTGASTPLAESWNGTAWSIQTMPTPTGATFTNLSAVSCVSATDCEAVGSSSNSTNVTSTLAESWNGTAWSIQATPNPTGATNAALTGVSCPSATSCKAVGIFNTGSTTRTLAESWNGTAWSIQATPNPTAGGYLLAVRCTSASRCFAVGGALASIGNRTLGETWNGTAWSIQAMPNPTGFLATNLEAISCVSSSSCITVGLKTNQLKGSAFSGVQALTVAEAWNGTAWSLQTTPNGTGAVPTSLSAISCASSTSCAAVGIRNFQAPLAEFWNGSAWSIKVPIYPTGAGSVSLNGVSCTSATSCIAVGWTSNSSGLLTLAEAWNGTAWSVLTTPNPTGTSASLNSVSCASATACTAVGSASDNSTHNATTLAESWNGTAWSIQATPNPTGTSNDTLSGVACNAASACTAVGSTTNNITFVSATLVEAWNGTAWTVQASPNPAGRSASLSGVSCFSSTSCMAAGESSGTTTLTTLAESWNGSSWSINATPNPAGASSAYLSAISCASASACTAVGNSFNSTTGKTLAEAWNGTAWSIQATPNQAGAFNFLAGVDCTAAATCFAVGAFSYLSSRALVERYS